MSEQEPTMLILVSEWAKLRAENAALRASSNRTDNLSETEKNLSYQALQAEVAALRERAEKAEAEVACLQAQIESMRKEK